jgi:hypothetical protein
MIWTFNELLQAEQPGEVQEIYHDLRHPAYLVTVNATFSNTSYHNFSVIHLLSSAKQPFFHPANTDWSPADKLEQGAALLAKHWSHTAIHLTATVISSERASTVSLCSILVKGRHNYFASSNAESPFCLVHNAGEDDNDEVDE